MTSQLLRGPPQNYFCLRPLISSSRQVRVSCLHHYQITLNECFWAHGLLYPSDTTLGTEAMVEIFPTCTSILTTQLGTAFWASMGPTTATKMMSTVRAPDSAVIIALGETQPNIVSGYNKFVEAESGQGCDHFITAHSTSTSRLNNGTPSWGLRVKTAEACYGRMSNISLQLI